MLLDTHALYWLVTAAEEMSETSLLAIAKNQGSGTLYVSPITAWELILAARKPPHKDPPNLGPGTKAKWFAQAIAATGAKIIPIRQQIACEAAAIIETIGHKDPGDCFLIATARVKKLPIVTRDQFMIELASRGYLPVITC